MNEFLPKNYEVPVMSGNYMKFEKGENLFRVLSNAVIGYEYWTSENKPVRLSKYPESVPVDIKVGKDGKRSIKHFWAFIVWNYKASKVQMLEITQSTIQGAIDNLFRDEDWGDPKQYDLKVTRTGEDLETEYAVNPKPKSPLKSEIEQEFSNTPFDLNNLFRGEEVFDVKTSAGTPVPTF